MISDLLSDLIFTFNSFLYHLKTGGLIFSIFLIFLFYISNVISFIFCQRHL